MRTRDRIGRARFALSALAVKVINVDGTADEVDDDCGGGVFHLASMIIANGALDPRCCVGQ